MFIYRRLGDKDCDTGHDLAGSFSIRLAEEHTVVASRETRRDEPGSLQVQPVHCLLHGTLDAAEVALSLTGAKPPTTETPHVTGWLLYAACVQAGLFDHVLPIFVVMPSGTRLDMALVEQAGTAVYRSGIGPGLLTLALGEAAAYDTSPDIRAISALRDCGIGIAIAVCESSDAARVIGQLPVSWLRLHPRLVEDVPNSRPARAAVERAVLAAHAADVRVNALGAATALQRDILADLGVDTATGPVFGPALAACEFRRALHCDWHP